MGDLNARLRELRNDREDELALTLEGSELEDVTAHFTPRRHYQGTGNWTWNISQEGRMVTGRGKYILKSDKDDFIKEGVREASLHRDHQMVLKVI